MGSAVLERGKIFSNTPKVIPDAAENPNRTSHPLPVPA
jgi:hypothetical protein